MAKSLELVLSAIDRVSPALKSVEKHVKFLNKAVHNLGSAGNILRERIGVPVSLMAAATTAGIFASVKAFGEYGGAVTDAADKTGIAVERLQELHYAGKKAGVETGAVDSALTKLNKNLGDAGAGKNKEFLALMDRLGINIRDTQGKVRNAADVMPELADAIEKNGNQATRTRMLMAAFGKTGADLVPMLKDGSKGLADMAKQGRDVGYVLSQQTIKNADNLDNGLEDLTDTMHGLSMSIAGKLAPVLMPLIQKFQAWIIKNRELISTKVEAFVSRVANALEKINWVKVGQGLESFWHGVEKCVEFVGGWNNALLGFVALANASVIVAIFQIGGAFINVGKVIFGAGAGIIRSFGMIAPAATAAWTGVAAGSSIAMGALSKVGSLISSNIALLGKMGALGGAAYAGWEAGTWANGQINEYVKEKTGRGSLGELIYDKTHTDTASKPISLDEINKVRAQSGRRAMTQAELDWVRGGKKGAAPGVSAAGAPAKANLQGELVVKIEGAPPGTRVEAGKTNQSGVKIKTDVGYRSATAGIR